MNPPIPAHHMPVIPTNVLFSWGIAFIVLIGAVVALILMARKVIRSQSAEFQKDWSSPKADTDNASAFMAASMQGVIEKLRAQEKELARLHMLAQERAQESERLTEEVTRNMPTGLLLVNANGAISSTNPAAEDALGMRPLRYRSYKELLGSDSGLAQMLTECLQIGETFQRNEVEHVTPEGEVRRLGVTISPIFQSARPALRTHVTDPPRKMESKVSGALCLMSDLTELTALQKQIRWKENLAALGEMSAGIAHEFKNALATISGYAQMIRSEAQPGDVRDSAERILDQTRALTHVVTEFLKFAKPLDISYETVSMQSLIERVARELHEVDPNCEVTCGGDFSELPGDEALIRQALVNLTRNGIEAARAAGALPRVTITGSIEELGGKRWQRICVADNGPGIPEHDLPKIFLPFYTTKSEGTGLGLAVVQKVALQHGGSIEARNRPGGGAEFLLWLPLRQARSGSLFPSRVASI
ncbi:MAG TPA: ATP-binding protein [Candidatus Acidoferrales bacterium]|nr:ATP-binding protein [Candidatus Acidoferrales bacterium]